MKQVKGKKKLAAIAMFLVIALIGGSLAYWSQELDAKNEFNTGKYGSELIEDVTQCTDEDWQPGGTVNKDVWVSNTGNYDIIVRVKLDEAWYRNDVAIKTIKFDDLASVNNSSAAQKFAIYDVYQNNINDGLITHDNSVVRKIFDNSQNWVFSSDGWWYYKGNLNPGTTSDKLLDSLILDKNTDMGVYVTNYLCTTDGTTWHKYNPANGVPKYLDASGNVVSKGTAGAAAVTKMKTETVLDPAKPGYSGADYRLTITTQTVQATKDAVAAEWFSNSSSQVDSKIYEIGASWVLN